MGTPPGVWFLRDSCLFSSSSTSTILRKDAMSFWVWEAFPLILITFWVWGRPPPPLPNPGAWALVVSVYSCSFVAVDLTSEPTHFRNSLESSSRPGRTFCPCWEGQWLKTLLDFILVDTGSEWKPLCVLSLLRRLVTETLLDCILIVCSVPVEKVSDWKPFWILSLLIWVVNENPCVCYLCWEG